MPVHFEVVIQASPAAPPLGVGIRFRRHRQQGRVLDRFEQGTAGRAEVAHRRTSANAHSNLGLAHAPSPSPNPRQGLRNDQSA